MQKYIVKIICIFLISATLSAQNQEKWSGRMADAFLRQHPDSIVIGNLKTTRWDYEQGLMLYALDQVWRHTADGKYLKYILKDLDLFVQPDGNIRTYKPEEYNIDNVATGRALLLAWQQTGKEKYKKAAEILRAQLARHPRTKENGFWHKQRYPNQMWLDGLYMAEPFYTEYSTVFAENANFDDIALQFRLIEQHLRDPKTGLLWHGYDESRQMPWANRETGCSPNFWSRSIGWYAMALVDVLDYFPKTHPDRPKLEDYLRQTAAAVLRYQDPASGCWWQITNRGGDQGNYLEASGTGMFVYAFLKGSRMGYLPPQYAAAGQKGWAGMLQNFISTDANGSIHLEKTVSVGGLGGTPYRDGSYEYYLSEPLRRDDLKGLGPFILAALEAEQTAEYPPLGKGKTVLLDRYFNNEYRNGERFHYTWEDLKDSGFSWWGDIFRRFGAKTASLDSAPTKASLRDASVYIIVDTDSKAETKDLHAIEDQDIKAIKKWVKRGGTLVLMANDAGHCNLATTNRISDVFGIHFTDKSVNMVQNNVYEQGAVAIPAGHSIFTSSREIFIKEVSVMDIKAPAIATLTHQGTIVAATASYGKGRVFAVSDPWLYNEYVDGQRLPIRYNNYGAAKDLTRWLLQTQL